MQNMRSRVMPSDVFKNAQVITSDGKNIPNSDLISGKSDSTYNVGLQKETIRYEAFRLDSEKNVNPASSTDKLPSEEEYICDLCMQKFYGSNELQEHRKNQHSAATGV